MSSNYEYEIKKFEVLSLQYNQGPNWDYAENIVAHSHQEAAEIWADVSDNEGDYSIITRGKHGPVLVRACGEELVKTFTIHAYRKSVYEASES